MESFIFLLILVLVLVIVVLFDLQAQQIWTKVTNFLLPLDRSRFFSSPFDFDLILIDFTAYQAFACYLISKNIFSTVRIFEIIMIFTDARSIT